MSPIKSLEEDLAACRDLQALGRYQEATALVERLVHHNPDPTAYAEWATSLMTQGYWGKALNVLEDALAIERKTTTPEVLLQMQVCLVTPQVHCLFGPSLQRATTIYRERLSQRDWNMADRHELMAADHYFRLIQFATMFRMVEPTRLQQLARTQIKACFRASFKRGIFDCALSLACTYQRVDGEPDHNSLLETLRIEPEVPELIKAHAMLTLTRTTSTTTNQAEQEVMETAAMEIFTRLGHSHGAWDVDLQRICRRLRTDHDEDLRSSWEKIQTCCDRFAQLDCPLQLMQALMLVRNGVEHLYAFDFQLLLQQSLEKMAHGTDTLHLVLLQIKAAALWLRQTGHTSKAIEAGNALFQKVSHTDCNWLKGFVAQVLAQAYRQLTNLAKAREWTEICSDNWTTLPMADRALAREEALATETLDRPMSLPRAQELIDAYRPWVQEELDGGILGPAIKKLEMLLVPILIEHPEIDASPWLDWLQAAVDRLPPPEARLKRASCFQLRAQFCLRDAGSTKGLAKEAEATEWEEQTVQLFLDAGQLYQAASARQQCALIWFAIYQRSGLGAALEQATQQHIAAGEFFRLIDQTREKATAAFWIALCRFEAWRRNTCHSDTVLDALSQAASDKDQERIDLSILGGLEAVLEKQRFRSEKHTQSINGMAITVCITEKRVDQLWEWVQKTKARSLSDILGLGALCPAALDDEIRSEPDMQHRRDQEQALLHRIAETSADQRLLLRGELRALQAEMRQHGALRRLIELREGYSTDLKRVRELNQQLHDDNEPWRLVFVDWFIHDGVFHVCILKDQEAPRIQSCRVDHETVRSWKRAYLDSAEGREKSIHLPDTEDNPMRQLDPLVEALADVAREQDSKRDVFVFSATDVLHSIPLHALWLNGAPVIEHHPVVYCASVTTFIQCHYRAKARPPRRGEKTIVAVYEDTAGRNFDFDPVEQSNIYDSALRLGREIGATVVQSAAANAMRLTSALQSSALLHFHGHCLEDTASMIEQALVLFERNFSVRDIFQTKLHRIHVTLIACGSASQRIAAGDEPLGLVTALLCAGASSVLGTLWPTASGCGRDFSHLLYTNLNESNPSDVASLAVALQDAVREIRGDPTTNAPYCWAPFVLHGASHWSQEG